VKRIIIISVLIFYETISISAQSLQRIHDEIIQSAAYIYYFKMIDSIRYRESGTGFLIGYTNPDTSKTCILLITNKHVLPNPEDSRIITVKIPYQLRTKNTFKEFNIEIYDKNNRLSNYVKFHKDKNTDIVAIIITPQYMAINPYPSCLHYSCLLRKSEFQEHHISVGSDIFIIGYPSNIYDERTASPIVRLGTIASYPTNDFYFNKLSLNKDPTLPNPLDGFLVDGSVFGGSSGSMILLKTMYELTDPQKFTFVKQGIIILGIISRNIRTEKDGSLDIGIAFSSDAILEVIEEFKYIFNED